jgi:hypothetical protein
MVSTSRCESDAGAQHETVFKVVDTFGRYACHGQPPLDDGVHGVSAVSSLA